MQFGRMVSTMAASFAVAVVIAGCGGNGGAPAAIVADYVGATVCETCHPSQYADMQESGHPYKLNKVVGGVPPTYPFSSVPNPPAGYDWSDITYVIGGFGWKARFLDDNGYIITGSAVQWNLATEGWSAYHGSESPGTKPYNCGACHTTGWTATGAGGPHQDGLAGMHGTFAEPGVTCEACHGPGSAHIESASARDISIDPTAEQCGTCHFRDAAHRIEAKGGFIRHHEQYDEMIAGGHEPLECVTCHDPHKGSSYSPGITRSCQSCHLDEASRIAHNPVATCIDCHMGRATKSAVAVHDYEGDVRTHIFNVSTAAEGKSAMFYDEGGKTYASGFVTLDFACYSCHRDPGGIGGSGSIKTLAELSAAATGMHD